jgi:hypothetical protein
MKRLAPRFALRSPIWVGLFTLWAMGCGDTGRERVELALFASGSAPRTIELGAGTARATLSRADVAFGPAYFCASATASAELCEVAVAELREAVLLRALEPTPEALGVLSATTGSIQSSVYDYGLSWLLTQNQVRASANAPGGHSAILEGTVERAGQLLRFSAAIDVKPSKPGQLTVNTQRTQHEIVGEGERLTLLVDPTSWIDRMNVDALFALDVDGDGSVVIPPDSTLYESILQGMLNRTPVGFRWE